MRGASEHGLDLSANPAGCGAGFNLPAPPVKSNQIKYPVWAGPLSDRIALEVGEVAADPGAEGVGAKNNRV
jgi:hypothetical protein